MIVPVITYGEGGYDPAKPNNNVVAVENIEVDDPTPTIDDLRGQLASANSNAKLRDVLGQILDVLDS